MGPRRVVAALRERGTSNIYWMAPFDELAREEIVAVIDGVHALISGRREFIPADNLNKCRACRLKAACDRAVKPQMPG